MPLDGNPRPCPLVTAEQVSNIASRPDPVLRNLQITLSYHDLTVALGRHLGRRNVCWSGFAVWASKTAGSFIRGEWLRGEIRRVAERVGPAHGQRLAAVDEQVRGCIALGNQKVYAEIGWLFAMLVEVLEAPASDRSARLDFVLQRLRPGPVEEGGQAGLAQALQVSVEAAALPEGRDRAERVLLASVLIGAHEQYRLQAEIAGALDAVWRIGPEPRNPWQREVQRRLAAWLRQRLTRWMMRLGLPETNLELGRDVPALPDGTMFPAELRRLVQPELRAVLGRFDRTPDTTKGSAAADWADYGDRMNYLADMFRSRQQTASLWRAPFEPRQAAAIRDGHVPAGRL